MKKILILCVATLLAFNASAWGPKGHDTVAYIAEQNLSRRTLKKVEKVLGGHSLVYVANWMDNASHQSKYAHTKTWHYVNVDENEGCYAESKKEAKGDVVVAINNAVERLKSGELSADEERVELMMLIHMMGDMHCPMHAGYKSDRGGNGTTVKYFGRQHKLHSVWDSEIVESAHRWGYKEWAEQVDRVNRKERKAIIQGTPNDWIEETVSLATDVYENSPTQENLSYDYVAEFAPVIERQFLNGGLRLAKLLEDIY